MSAPSARERRPGEPLAWGSRTDVRPTRTAERPCMRLLAFREIRKGTLIGYARIRLPIGMTCHHRWQKRHFCSAPNESTI